MILLLIEFQPSFISKDSVQFFPIIGLISKLINSIFTSHARGTGLNYKGTSSLILERQKSNQGNENIPKFIQVEIFL